MSIRPLYLFLFLLSVLTTSVIAQGVSRKLSDIDSKLDDDFTQIAYGMTNHDYKIIYGYLYTPIMDQISKKGGVDKLIEASQSREIVGMRIQSYKAVPPFVSVTGKDRDYVVIPTLTKMAVHLSGTLVNMKSTGYILAVKVHGAPKWQYVYDYLMTKDKDAQNDPKREFFPDLPDNILFPSVETSNE